MANYRGVSYTDSPQTYRQSRSMSGSFASGMQLGQSVKRLIDDKRSARKLDRLLSSLGEEPPTQTQYAELSKLTGPDVANELLNYHKTMSNLRDEERDSALQGLRFTVDVAGTISTRLREVPEEHRMEQFTTVMMPMLQTDGPMKEWLRPIIELFKDGVFSEDRLDTLGSMSYTFGRDQEIQSNKLTMSREDDAITEDTRRWQAGHDLDTRRVSQDDRRLDILEGGTPSGGGGRGTGTPQTEPSTDDEIVKHFQEFGGSLTDWNVFLGDQRHNMMKESFDEDGNSVFINVATNKPLDLGSYSRPSGQPGDVEIHPGSPGSTIRKDTSPPAEDSAKRTPIDSADRDQRDSLDRVKRIASLIKGPGREPLTDFEQSRSKAKEEAVKLATSSTAIDDVAFRGDSAERQRRAMVISGQEPPSTQKMVEAMMAQYGGDRQSWHLMMLQKDARNMVNQSVDADGNSVFVNTTTNERLNLGTWQ